MNYIKDYFKDAKMGDEVIDYRGFIGKIIQIKDDYITARFDKSDIIFDINGIPYYKPKLKHQRQCFFYKGYEPKIEIPEPPTG